MKPSAEFVRQRKTGRKTTEIPASPTPYSYCHYILRSQDFSKGGGGGGHTGSSNIVMAFSPQNIVGCLLKKGLQRGGGGHGHPGTPLATPLYIIVLEQRYQENSGLRVNFYLVIYFRCVIK